MKKVIIVLALVVIILGIGATFFTSQSSGRNTNAITPTAPSALITQSPVKITFPTSKDALTEGKTYTLSWEGGGDQLDIHLIDISLESKGSSSASVDQLYGINNSHSYAYTVPTDIKAGKYIFKIGSVASQTFTINK